MREEEGGKETRGEGGERSCKQRLDSQGATITRIKTLVPQVKDRSWWTGRQNQECVCFSHQRFTQSVEKKTPDIQE